MNPATTAFVERFCIKPVQGLLLTGTEGIGLYSLAHYLAQSSGQLLEIIQPESKTKASLPTISTERIRQTYETARSRQIKASFIIIDDADSMTTSAQNALLKLLEEPNQSTHFILTSHRPDRLLPTIRSRLQNFNVPRIDDMASHRLVKKLSITDDTLRSQILYVATGLPAEISRLAADKKYLDELLERAATARRFIEGRAYDRLVLIQSFKEDRAGALSFIRTLLLILERVYTRTPSSETATFMRSLIEASEAIQANGNIRLHLSAAVV